MAGSTGSRTVTLVAALCLGVLGVCRGNMFSADSEAGNLFHNGGFEKSAGNDLSNWDVHRQGTSGGVLTVVTDDLQACSGNRCVRLEAPKGTIGVMQKSRIFPGRRYVVSVYARGEGALIVHLPLYYFEGHRIHALKPEGFQHVHRFEVSETWTRYAVTFTAPEGVFSMAVGIRTRDPGPVYIDNAALAYAHPATVRFLPSIERLTVDLDATPFDAPADRAQITVLAGAEPVVEETVRGFVDGQAYWQHSTADLPEGDYTVRVRVLDAAGKVIAEDDDWFKKKIFPWMTDKPWRTDKVPAPWTPLAGDGTTIEPWGRTYGFAPTGLLTSVVSQETELLAAPMALVVELADGAPEIVAATPFAVGQRAAATATGGAQLAAGDLAMELVMTAEYDGLVRYRLTYRPRGKAVTIRRLRLRVPLKAEYAFLYSAGTDRHGKCILADVLPQRQGKVYDSLADTRCAYCSPTFCTLFWVGGYDTCFCYAADSDVGWVLRDDAPAVEAWREGEQVVLWLNLVDREYELIGPRTLEFAFQAGPVKPRPRGWRGVQFDGDPDDAPTTVSITVNGGGGLSTGGGTNWFYPGDTQALRDRFRDKLLGELGGGGNRAVTGYWRYGMVPRGLPETAVFRSEWGIDKAAWEAPVEPKDWKWQQRWHGDDPSRYVLLGTCPVPSLIDCATWAYSAVLDYLPYTGFYDDVGHPKPVYRPELGWGGTDPAGRKVYSSGLWIYRQRWRQAMTVNWQHGRPNYLRDSQHTRAHYLPAYGFIGLWTPCEHGYYNQDPEKDIFEFYGSLTRYLAFNPARQFGQIPMVGMGTLEWTEAGTDRDTRAMMMMAMLHDQDVGGFGRRNLRTVCRLRHARNVFRPWDDDVTFSGYWENGNLVRTDSPDVQVSLFRRPGSVLFVLGNTGDEERTVVLTPAWKRLGIAPVGRRVVDTESLAAVPAADDGCRLTVRRHDLRVVLAGDLGGYELAPLALGADLPGPEHPLAILSEPLTDAWEHCLHEGHSDVGLVDGTFYIQGNHYGYALVRRRLPADLDSFTAQCLVLRAPSGGQDSAAAGLALAWDNGAFVRATPGRRTFVYTVDGKTANGSAIGTERVPGWYPYRANWVKIRLTPEQVELYGSADGRTWVLDRQIDRTARFTGAPTWLILGNGGPGEAPGLANIQVAKHFNATNPTTTFFADLRVGREPNATQ